MSFKTDFPTILPDFITPRNFLFFLISREYIEYSSNIKCFNELIDEETKFTFYLFLFKASKDASIDLFKYIKENDNPLKKKLNSLVVKRLEIIVNDVNELISYNDILEVVNNVLSPFHERADLIGNDGRGKVCKHSVIGIFLKKFCLAFQSLSLEKINLFMEGFRKVIVAQGIIPGQNKSTSSEKMRMSSLILKQERLSEDQIRWSLENIHNDLENVLFDPNSDGKLANDLRHKLHNYKQMFPDISESFFVDNLLTMHNKDFEVIENDIQMKYPAKFLSSDEMNHRDPLALHDSNKDSNKKVMLMKNYQTRQKLSEVSLNSVITFSSMGFKDEALMHYKDAISNANLSRKADLLAEVGSVGNSLMPINDNPNGAFYSLINGTTMNDKTALGNIRDFLLLSLNSNRNCLAELLHQYFCSPAPQRREISPICLVYLSIIFRSFGFESMANTYLIIAASLESIRRTKNHQDVLVEVFSQLISNYSISGRFDKAINLYNSLPSIGGGVLASNSQLQASLFQTLFSQALMRLDFSSAYRCLEKLRQVSLAEYGLRMVQILFTENNAGATRLGNHIISFAVTKREILFYNHVSISNGCATISSRISHHHNDSREFDVAIDDYLSELTLVKDLPTLDDAFSQNWGCRDWAIYECRCRWLMCTQLINRHEIKTAKVHLDTLQSLSRKFHFYQYQRVCQVLQLAIASREGEPVACPLNAGVSNRRRAASILSSKLGLPTRQHMSFVNLLVNLFVSQSDAIGRDRHIENLLTELVNYCDKCGDRMGLAHCWQMIYRYNDAVGNEDARTKALFELELLLENKLTQVPNLDFLSHIL